MGNGGMMRFLEMGEGRFCCRCLYTLAGFMLVIFCFSRVGFGAITRYIINVCRTNERRAHRF